MKFKNMVSWCCIWLASSVYANTTENAQPNNSAQNTQTVQVTNDAPFLRKGESVTIVGGTDKHNYVSDMKQMKENSIFKENAILFLGGFLLIAIFSCSFIYFYVSKKHKNQEGTMLD